MSSIHLRDVPNQIHNLPRKTIKIEISDLVEHAQNQLRYL